MNLHLEVSFFLNFHLPAGNLHLSCIRLNQNPFHWEPLWKTTAFQKGMGAAHREWEAMGVRKREYSRRKLEMKEWKVGWSADSLSVDIRPSLSNRVGLLLNKMDFQWQHISLEHSVAPQHKLNTFSRSAKSFIFHLMHSSHTFWSIFLFKNHFPWIPLSAICLLSASLMSPARPHFKTSGELKKELSSAPTVMMATAV